MSSSGMICADRRDRVPGIHAIPAAHGAESGRHLRGRALAAHLLHPPRDQQGLGLELVQKVQPELRPTLGKLERAPQPQDQAEPRHGIGVRNRRCWSAFRR